LKRVLGRTDNANFPELHLSEIDIKVDTGAYTSAIHCHEIEEVSMEGKSFIKFKLLDPFHPKYNEKEFIFKKYRKKRVKSSFGISEERFVIQTVIEMFNEQHPIYLTLSERSSMRYPILLGRKFITNRFIIDTSKKNLSIKSNTSK